MVRSGRKSFLSQDLRKPSLLSCSASITDRKANYRKKTRTLENLGGGDVELTQADLDEIASVLEKNPVHGHRYLGKEVDLKLWG